MSSGGMDWAYRMMALHKLDSLGRSIVLHLGWRDHPAHRTDRAIATAFCCDRKAVRKATAKLAEAGIIERAPNGCWVALETVAIVMGHPDAPSPGRMGDGEGASGPRGSQAPSPGGLRPPKAGVSGPPKRKEKIEKARGPGVSPRPAARPLPEGSGQRAVVGGVSLTGISPFLASRIRAGETCVVAGVQVVAKSEAMREAQAALYALERGAV